MRYAWWWFAMTFGMAGLSCLDGAPLIVPVEAGIEDAPRQPDSPEDDGGKATGCRDCFMGQVDAAVTCAAQWERCASDPKCADTLECANAAGCLALAQVFDIVTCGTPCAVDAGIFSADDPAVLLILPILDCVTKECRAACQ